MNSERKIMSLAGISRKAGKMTLGSEKTLESIRSRKQNSVKVILMASDASDNTRKKINNCAGFYGVPVVNLETDKATFGQKMGVFGELSVAGISDSGLASAIINSDNNEKNEQA